MRVQALVCAALGRSDAQEAALLKALAVAAEIGASSWRLRAAVDLARLWPTQSHRLDAKGVRVSAFTLIKNGFQTRDLATAAALLSDLE